MIQFFSSGVCSSGSNSWFQVVHLFFPGVPSFVGYLVTKLHLNHCKASPCVFNFPFFLSSFCHRSSSWRLYMVVHQGFFSFFNCSSRFLLKLWPAKLYSKINMVLNTCCFWGVQVFFILHSKVQFFLPYLLRWWYVILDNFPSSFMIHKLSRMRYFKNHHFFSWIMRSFQPSNFFVGVILGYISPKAFPKDCCYLWCL